VFRTRIEWADHVQGSILQASPPVALTRVGDSEPEPLRSIVAPLDGVRVVDLTRVLSGPSSAKLLAAFGAQVMHVASPAIFEQPVCIVDGGFGKLSSFIDFRRGDEAQALRTLIGAADVFVQNVRHGSLDKRGFGLEEMVTHRPGLIYVSINCYGARGPWAGRRGYEPHADAATGMHTRSDPTEAPHTFFRPVSDYVAGWLAALGAMAAMWARASDGGSYHVAVSLARTSMWIQSLGDDLDPAAATGVNDISAYELVTDTPFGTIRHLRPPVQLSRTPTAWRLPAVPLGTHEPRWPGGGEYR
jgi:hypothetical protein